MTDKINRVAKAIYEADDVWSAAFPWPSMPSKDQSADNYRRIARAAIEVIGEPTEAQLDAVRHIIQWHTFERPTEAALLRHCKALRKEPPAECRDVEHVPPTNLVSYWIFKGMITAALNDGNGEGR